MPLPIIFGLIGPVVRAVEAIVVGRKKGATKKQIALSWLDIAQKAMAADGTLPAVVPSEELGQDIDDTVAALKALGTLNGDPAAIAQQGLFTGLEVVQLIQTFMALSKPAPAPPPASQ